MLSWPPAPLHAGCHGVETQRVSANGPGGYTTRGIHAFAPACACTPGKDGGEVWAPHFNLLALCCTGGWRCLSARALRQGGRGRPFLACRGRGGRHLQAFLSNMLNAPSAGRVVSHPRRATSTPSLPTTRLLGAWDCRGRLRKATCLLPWRLQANLSPLCLPARLPSGAGTGTHRGRHLP